MSSLFANWLALGTRICLKTFVVHKQWQWFVMPVFGVRSLSPLESLVLLWLTRDIAGCTHDTPIPSMMNDAFLGHVLKLIKDDLFTLGLGFAFHSLKAYV